MMRSIVRSLLFLSIGAVFAAAETIHFVGVPTGVNDGVDYVTPYQIDINGFPQLVTCYDVFDNVNFGDVFEANLLTLDQAAAGGYFAGQLDGYKRVAWLDAQRYSDDAEQVGVQHAIWNVFGHTPETAETLRYEAAADAAQANAFSGFDFSRFRFIEQPGGVVGAPGTEQAFVFALPAVQVPALSNESPGLQTAEPKTGSLLSCAAVAFLLATALRRQAGSGLRKAFAAI